MTATKPLILGRIDYLNCRPLYEELEQLSGSYYRLVAGNPAELNQRLEEGRIDVSPSSSILPAVSPHDDYFILSGIAIASLKEVRSVLLLSRREAKELKGCSISLTGHSLTSIFLLKIILTHCFGLRLEELEFISGEFLPTTGNEAALVIGDRALELYHHPPTGYHIYDLGRLWHELTGLPFVYALWFGRREAQERQAAKLERLRNDLNRICRRLPEKLETLSRHLAPQNGFTPSQLSSYWQDAISYRLDTEAQRGLELFYRLAAELELIRTVPRLAIF
jgi:chorismate dehydratase